MCNEKQFKIQIWSHWIVEPESKYLYGEYTNLEKASKVIRNFIYGTKHNHEYIIKIIAL